MYDHLFSHFNPHKVNYLFSVLAATVMLFCSTSRVAAQTTCTPPGVPYSYDISGQVLDEGGKPLGGVPVYASGSAQPLATTGSDGKWRATMSGCTLSPPRCGTGIATRFVPIKQGYFFTPQSGEICPDSSVNFVAKTSSFFSVSGASYQTVLASGSIASAFADAGVTLATDTQNAPGLPLPESLAGTTATITFPSGFTTKALLYFVSPRQVNYYLPYINSTSSYEGPVDISIQNANGVVFKSSALITRVAPAFFSADSTGQGTVAAVAQRIKADGTNSYESVALYNPVSGKADPIPVDLGPETDRVFLAVFGTGIRNRKSLGEVTAKVGGINAEVVYAGSQNQFEGVDQVNILLPRGLAGRGEVTVEIFVEGQAANVLKVTIR